MVLVTGAGSGEVGKETMDDCDVENVKRDVEAAT